MEESLGGDEDDGSRHHESVDGGATTCSTLLGRDVS